MTIIAICMRAFENFNLLRAFVCIVECGNISAGARSIGVSQKTHRPTLREADSRQTPAQPFLTKRKRASTGFELLAAEVLPRLSSERSYPLRFEPNC
jgi:hypothetical protein